MACSPERESWMVVAWGFERSGGSQPPGRGRGARKKGIASARARGGKGYSCHFLVVNGEAEHLSGQFYSLAKLLDLFFYK